MMETEATGPWVSVYNAPDEWRAQIAKDWLLEENIPAVIQSYVVPGYNIRIESKTSWGDVLVPPAMQAAATEILERLMPEE